MKQDLRKILKLLRQNREDKCFLMDESGQAGFVLMTIEEYEKLKRVDLTDDQLLSKINQEIAFLKEKELERQEQELDEKEFADFMEEENDEEEERYYFESL